MTPTSKRLAARAAARRRQAKANEDQHQREQTELDHATEFEVARLRRDDAAATVIAHELAMARQVETLLSLGNPVSRVAELTGEPEAELKRLRKLAETDARDVRVGASNSPKASGHLAGRRANQHRTAPIGTVAEPPAPSDDQDASIEPRPMLDEFQSD